MNPNESKDPRFGILKTGTTVSDSPSWLDSLITQIRELREEKNHPQPKVAITAQEDPSALDKLIEMPSPLLTLFTDTREAINDILHPRKTESSVQPVEVEEIWSKPKAGVPRLLSLFAHVLVVSLALVPWATSLPKVPKVNETAVFVYTPQNLVLPLTADQRDSGGGGGGDRKSVG